MNTNEMAFVTGMFASLSMLYENPPSKQRETFRLGGRGRTEYPWDNVQLTKGERKGKSCQELQELRFNKWKQRQGV